MSTDGGAVRSPTGRPGLWVRRPLSRAGVVGLWALVAVLALRLAPRLIPDATRPSNGFVAYYTAARLLLSGADAAGFYDDPAFAAETRKITPGISDIFNVNPPTTSLLMLPLAWLPYAPARAAWTAVSVASVAGVVLLLWRVHGLRGPWLAGTFALLLVFQPLGENLRQGQAYALLLALFALAWDGFRRRLDGRLGVTLGTAAVLKGAGALLWLLVLAGRRWRALALAAMTVLAVGIAALPWLGADAWRTFAGLVPQLGTRPSMSVSAYQSVPGLLRHLLVRNVPWNPAPWIDAPGLAVPVTMAVSAVMIVLSLATTVWTRDEDLVFSCFVLAGLALTPYSMDYHYTLALLPILVLVPRVRERGSPWLWVTYGAAVTLMAADLPYRSPRLAAGARAVLAYPKLAGACLLWIAVVWQARSSRGLDVSHGGTGSARCASRS